MSAAPPPDDDSLPPGFTGLICQSCKAPIAQPLQSGETWITFHCPACGHRWMATGPEHRPN